MPGRGRYPPHRLGFPLIFKQTANFAAIRIDEEASVSAVDEGERLPNEPSCLVADVVIDPVAFGDASCLEKHLGNLVTAGVGTTAIHGSQAEDEPVDHLRRENAWRLAGLAAHQPAPEPQGGCGANVEQPVQRQQDGGLVRSCGRNLHAQDSAAKLDDELRTCGAVDPTQRIRRKLDVRCREAFGRVGQRGDRGKRPGRPQNATGRRAVGGIREIVPPSAGRRLRRRRDRVCLGDRRARGWCVP